MSEPSQSPRPAATGPGSDPALAGLRRAERTGLLLVSSTAIGLALAVACGFILLEKMRAPLQAELEKRAVALCRTAAAELDYAATVGDAPGARRALADLAREPSAEVEAAMLYTRGEEPLASFARPGAPAWRASASPAPEPGHGVRALGPQRYLEVTCPVQGIQVEGSRPAGHLALLVAMREVESAVHSSFRGALAPTALVIFVAMVLQLLVARFVIRTLGRALRNLREAQRALVQADKLAALGTLAAGVAHEINNPLSYVIANLSYALEQTAPGAELSEPSREELRQALREARGGAERVAAIVQNLRMTARRGEEDRRPVDVAAVVDAALKIVGHQIHHRARLVRDVREAPPVHAVEGRLVQVLVNLLVNAAQAIETGTVEENEIRVAVRAGDGVTVVIEVADTGCGIAPEVLPRLFEPFFTTKPVGSGTGLGLSVCHGIVTSLGGALTVESQPGRGSTFRVALPAGAEEPSVAVRAGEPRRRRGARARILVVDDEPLVGKSIQRLLGAEHDVTCTASAREALDMFERGDRFHVILCDVMMPEMHGVEFRARLAARDPHAAASVVFMTGGAFTAAAREGLEGLPNPCLRKPLDVEQLSEILEARAPAVG